MGGVRRRTLAEFADLLDTSGQDYDVLDAADLQRAPEPTLRAWCARHDLDFDPATLRWEPGVVAQWNRWLEFHASAIASSGFTAREPSNPPVVTDGRIAELVERAAPLHQRLLARAASS
ncbi:hypothetical protein [Actinospongicola halichondriae]|uniref:sulfotransferase-like domain-containing protein n=1 Tax=Actinospongicola halichondriae TaxID=3236844 RepID=UPI003D5C5172